jgi:uncharacterized protein YfaS (alpha-2-macroglobulin family)
MVLVELPIPAGFVVESQSLQKLVDQQQIAKFQVTPRNTQIYLRSLGKQGLGFDYQLRATLPVTTTTPSAVAYDYYAPQTRATSQPSHLVVAPRQ